jgi:hypothetical protein
LEKTGLLLDESTDVSKCNQFLSSEVVKETVKAGRHYGYGKQVFLF